MHEGVVAAAIRLDEAIALIGIEELYGSDWHGECILILRAGAGLRPEG
jgi:hypothetical protein